MPGGPEDDARMDALRSYGFFGAGALLVIAWVAMGAAGSPWALPVGLLAALFLCAGAIQRSVRWGIVATSALGLWAGWYLFDLKVEAVLQPACNLNAYFDCGKVNTSSWSELGGVPVGLIGAAFYAGLMLAALVGGRGEAGDRRLAGLTLLLSVPAVLYSVVLAGASVSIGAFCVVCATMYVANGLLLWAGLRGGGRQAIGGSLLTSAEAIVVVAVFVAGIWMGQARYEASRIPSVGPTTGTTARQKPRATDFTRLYRAPCAPLEITGDEPVTGPPDARWQIVEFADYGCPHCATAARELKQLLAARDDVSLRFKYFPRSNRCNGAIPSEGDPIGVENCHAAAAAECAHRQGNFWRMNELLFTNQGWFQRDQLRTMAEQAGLDVASWETCLDSPDVHRVLVESGRAGGDVCLEGTPTLFLKGLHGDAWVQVQGGVDGIRALIEAAESGLDLPPPT